MRRRNEIESDRDELVLQLWKQAAASGSRRLRDEIADAQVRVTEPEAADEAAGVRCRMVLLALGAARPDNGAQP